jgi:hypothetical protein
VRVTHTKGKLIDCGTNKARLIVPRVFSEKKNSKVDFWVFFDLFTERYRKHSITSRHPIYTVILRVPLGNPQEKDDENNVRRV